MSYATNGGVRIYYEVEGHGPPLVLHHGMSVDHDSFRQFGFAGPLGRAYTLILVDGRGHGRSDKPHDPDAYSLEARANDIVAVLDDLGVETAHYIGYSLGGWTGLGLAKHALHRVRSLGIGGAQPYGQSMELFRQAFAGGIEAWAALADKLAGELPEAVRRQIRSNDIEALRASVAYDRPDISEVIASVDVPCLLYTGDQDPLHDLVKRCADELADATFVTVQGADHVRATFRSDVLVPEFRRFLARAEAAWQSRAATAVAGG